MSHTSTMPQNDSDDEMVAVAEKYDRNAEQSYDNSNLVYVVTDQELLAAGQQFDQG